MLPFWLWCCMVFTFDFLHQIVCFSPGLRRWHRARQLERGWLTGRKVLSDSFPNYCMWMYVRETQPQGESYEVMRTLKYEVKWTFWTSVDDKGFPIVRTQKVIMKPTSRINTQTIEMLNVVLKSKVSMWISADVTEFAAHQDSNINRVEF